MPKILCRCRLTAAAIAMLAGWLFFTLFSGSAVAQDLCALNQGPRCKTGWGDRQCNLEKAKINTDWVLTKDSSARATYERYFKQCGLQEGKPHTDILGAEHDPLIYRHAFAIRAAQRHNADAYCSLDDCIAGTYHVNPGDKWVWGIDFKYIEHLFYLQEKGLLAK